MSDGFGIDGFFEAMPGLIFPRQGGRIPLLPGNADRKTIAARVDLNKVGEVVVIQCIQLRSKLHEVPRGLDDANGFRYQRIGRLDDRIVK